MASRSIPRGATQRKVATYGRGSRGRDEKKTGASSYDSAQASSNLYDFPDSDDSSSSPLPSKAPQTASKHTKSQSRDVPVTKLAAPDRSPAKRAPERSLTKRALDDGRKRRQNNNSDGDSTVKNPTTSPVLQRTLSAASVPKPGRPAVLPTHKKATSRSVASLVEAHEDNALSSAPKSSTSQNVEGATLKRPASEIQTSGMAAPRPRKTRLIDRLSAQKAGSSSESEYESDTDRGWDADEGDLEQGAPSASQTAPLTPRSKRAALLDREIWTRPAHTHAGLSASKKVKHTYSQSRSIRSDAQPGGNDVFGVSGDLGNNPLLLSPSKPSPGPFAPPVDEFDLDGSDDEDRTIAIKSVHELRRAGANNRFADEMEDLLSRIGTPRSPTSSMRRNALLELAQKLQQQDFSLQFRDHSARDTIAKKVGDEQDIVSGFAITASLVMFLSFNNAPNLLRQLMEERVGELLGRLLRVQEDVGSIAKQRTANLSKHGRGVVNDVKAHLQRMDIWHGRQPTGLSPRSIALQLHYILQRNLEARHRGDMIKRLEKDFAIIAEDQALHAPLNDSLAPLVVLIMEAELGAATAVLTPSQLRQRASNTALFLQATLAKWPGDRGEKQSATLKLAIDTTNTEVGAEAFGNAPLLAAVARAVSQGLDEVQRAAHSQSFDAGLYDGLLLVLGIMINVLEHSPRARASIDTASTEKLAELFLQNRKSVAAADSEDKSKVNIAVGYLAVILGYICLEKQGRQAAAGRGADALALIDAIREFIEIHRSVDSKVHELEGLVQDLRRCSR